MLFKQVKPEVSKSWSPLHASLKSCAKFFHKYIGYYVIDQNTNNNTWSIRKETKQYIMFVKRKRSGKVKAKGCAEGRYHRNFNHELESRSHLVPSCAHKGSCVMNAMDYNYRLRSQIV